MSNLSVFSVTSDGEARLYLADSFADAFEQDFKLYLEDNADPNCNDEAMLEERKYHLTIVEAIVQVGTIAKLPHNVIVRDEVLF